jgi:trimeric autotransporter adhesin
MKSFKIVFGLLLAAGAATAQLYTISTVAGIGTAQGSPYLTTYPLGATSAALLAGPNRVAVGSKGDFYIADYLANAVWIVLGGQLSVFAGNGIQGFQGDNGPGYQAELNNISGLTVDAADNVYIADTGNHRVRLVNNPAANIYTFAGNGTAGYAGDGGKATNAELNFPAGLVADSAGNIYISDYGNYNIRKVDTKGNISTFAGIGSWGYSGDGGPATKAAFASPMALAIDSAGDIYIGDPGNNNIREITPDGNIHTVVSNVNAVSIAVDSANSIYYPNWQNSTVQKILSDGTQFAIAGNGTFGFSGDGGPATNAALNFPYGVALDSSGNVYVADYNNYAIRLLTPVASSIGIVSAASGVGLAVAPGEIVAIYGTAIGPVAPATAQPGSNGNFPTELAGSTVSFNGINAPLLYTSATQIDAIVPYGVSNSSVANVIVNYQSQTLTSAGVPIVPAAPGIFSYNGSGAGQAAATNQDGSINSISNPAQPNSIVTFYLTGEGVTNPPGTDGGITPLPPAPPRAPVQPISVYLSGQQVNVPYAAEAPGQVAGMMQINAQIPPGLLQTPNTSPVAVPVLVVVGSSFTQAGVTIAVAP